MDNEIETYRALNELATPGGIVIFGGGEDRLIPLCELKQAFALQEDLYNRSVTGLSVDTAAGIFDGCVAELEPEDILIHIGGADLHAFEQDSAAFDEKYRRLLRHIQAALPDCRVGVISLKNPDKQPLVAQMNRHLAVITRDEGCEFCDISTVRVWNPKQTKDVLSFICSMGFVRPLKKRRPLYDLVKILFCCEPSHIA